MFHELVSRVFSPMTSQRHLSIYFHVFVHCNECLFSQMVLQKCNTWSKGLYDGDWMNDFGSDGRRWTSWRHKIVWNCDNVQYWFFRCHREFRRELSASISSEWYDIDGLTARHNVEDPYWPANMLVWIQILHFMKDNSKNSWRRIFNLVRSR